MTVSVLDDSVANDEEIARALQEQFREEEEAAAAAAADRRRVDDELRAAEAFETSAFPAGAGDDADVARRMDQEARDAAFAASLARRDVEAVEASASRGDAGGILAPDEEALRRQRRKRSINSLLSCLLAVVLSFVLYQFFFRRTSIVGGGGGGGGFDLADWFQGGAWETGHNEAGNNAWAFSRRSSSGLDLRVLNNLDQKWQVTFSTVMTEWDNGDPDAVSFRVERISDPSCRMVPDVMVVCNDDYGQTSWRGVNELLTENGFIVASVAKLNDFFLENTNDALRQYVCCHEIGHGLGLGHTDEAIYNRDLGECMDYTVRPEVNMHPGKTNFDALAEMYGVVGGSRILGENPSARRMDDVEYSPEDVDWRMLRRTKHAEHYEADIGDGRKVRRVFLLA